MDINLTQSEMIKLSFIEPNNGQIEGLPKNPRLIKNDKYKKLVKSLQDHPQMLGLRELLVYPHGDKFVIIGGNMRYTAMKELKFKTAPCKVISASTSVDDLKAYTIKDNSGFGDWDFDLLANDWDMSLLNVLDLFGGSGTTLIACEQLKRKCFMMEYNPHYCDVIIARWEKLTGKKAVKIA